MTTVLITGATSGIGLACALALAKEGFHVIGIGRDKARCKTAEAEIQSRVPNAGVLYFAADLMQQREVNRVCDDVSTYLEQHCEGKLFALINNAGCARSWYTTTEEGYEQLFALNHLAGFLTTYRLLPYLINASGRVIMTGSRSHKYMRIHWNDIMFQKRYHPLLAYKQSKLCNILFAKALNERFSRRGLHAYTVDPGLVRTEIGCKDTSGLVSLVWNRRKRRGVSPDIPAKTYVYLCKQEPAPEGLYYHLCKPERYGAQADRENAERLFHLSENLCGVCYDERMPKP
jgi:NAD(P)-dependent dehydrogenase (short-subunit alcohol dehydrogenase family)